MFIQVPSMAILLLPLQDEDLVNAKRILADLDPLAPVYINEIILQD